jgi:hypothetical protein
MQDSGGGLNSRRKHCNRLMEMVERGQARRLVSAHRDRLVRFGSGSFEAFCERQNTEIVVIDGETLSPEQERVQDPVAMLTVCRTRLHGLRSWKKVLKDAAVHKDQAERQDARCLGPGMYAGHVSWPVQLVGHVAQRGEEVARVEESHSDAARKQAP